MNPILDSVEESLRNFRPKTHRQFVVLGIATRFHDVPNLARYLNICDEHPKRVLIEAARLAEQEGFRTGVVPIEPFFRLLSEWRKEAT